MKLSDKQKLISELLQNFNPLASQAYLGSLEVLEHGHKDKIHQSANSIRHALGLITRSAVKKEETESKQEGGSHRKKIRKLVDPLVGLPSELDFHIKLLIDEYHSWFHKVAHYAIIPTERQYRRKFAAMEEVLLKVIRPHFDVIAEIDRILVNEKPSKLSFGKLQELIARDLSCYDHFFQNATSDWLPFLVKKGYFDNPVHLIKENDGIRYGFLSPSGYLARIAESKQIDVLKLILKQKVPAKEGRNPLILENFISAAMKMHSKHAGKIAKRISQENWLDVLYFSRLDELVSDLMVKLSNDGYYKDAVALARTLFDLKLTEPYPRGGILEEFEMVQDVRPAIDDYWYREIARSKLPIIARNDPKSVINLLVSLLNKSIYLENLGRNHKNSNEDTSVAWRPAIENHEQNYDFDFRTVLVDALRDSLESEGNRNIRRLKTHLKLISEKKYPFFQRLTLYIYMRFPKQFRHNIEQSIINHVDRYELRHEYYHLLKETFPIISTKSKKAFLKIIEKGPNKKTIQYWKRNQRIYPNETIELKRKVWTIDKLEPIAVFLEGELKRKYELMIGELGTPENPDFRFWHSGFHSSEPRTNLADNLSPNDVINFIKSYKINDESDFPFYDGTKQKFQEYVEKNPEEFSNKALELKSADSIFSYALLSGLEIAIQSDKKIAWKQTLLLCNYIIKSTAKGTYEQPKGYDIVGAIANLIGAGLESKNVSPPFALRDTIWKLLISSIPLRGSDESWENNYPDKNWDAINIAFNTTSGKIFQAIFRYALWCNSNIKRDKPEFVSEVKGIIEEYFGKWKNTIPIHAVLGRNLPNLIYLDKDWTLEKLSKIFPDDNKLLTRSAWDAYLNSDIRDWVFKEIIPYYSEHVKNLKSPILIDGKLSNFDQHAIEHITIAHTHKLSGAHSLFEELRTSKSDAALQHSAWTVSRILKQYKEKPYKSLDLDSIKKIWKENNLARQKETDLWFTYSPFDKNESLRLLLESLKKTGGEIGFASMIETELESYAEELPLQTAECLELILKSEKNRASLYAVRRTAIRNLLRFLLASKDRKAVKKTKELIHFLGTLGFNEYGDLLK